MKFEKVLDEARSIVRGDRNQEYGSFEDMMVRTAEVWSGILDHEVQPAEVAMCMAGLKLVRMQQNPGKADSFVDALGYTAMAADILDEGLDPAEEARLIRNELWLHGADLPTTTEHLNDRA